MRSLAARRADRSRARLARETDKTKQASGQDNY